MNIVIDLSITSWVYPAIVTLIAYVVAYVFWGEKGTSRNIMGYGGGGLVDLIVYSTTTILVLFMWLVWLVIKLSVWS